MSCVYVCARVCVRFSKAQRQSNASASAGCFYKHIFSLLECVAFRLCARERAQDARAKKNAKEKTRKKSKVKAPHTVSHAVRCAPVA
jgi:hypothetical protein